MSYSKQLTIPAGTSKTSPVSTSIEIPPTLVDRLEITFPSGCVGLVGVRFQFQGRVIWPYNPDGWFLGNGQTVTFTPNLELKDQPNELMIEGYNDDDTFAHAVYVIIDVEFKGGLLDVWKALLFGGGTRINSTNS
ncbi:hypothetical protein LCGC14_1299710 [marine sediment metagenome]|uniref:Uncharacterized protein n=1 Tax=marine sediment metagenome TaxID=412755 RepID=A0A0F9KRK2_9ZZZZ